VYYRFINVDYRVVEPQPILVRAEYVASALDLEREAPNIRKVLLSENPPYLLNIFPSPTGSPYRLAQVFCPGDSKVCITIGSGRQSLNADAFFPVGPEQRPWDRDNPGSNARLFVTGIGGPSNIWRIHRVEHDAWGSPVIDLAPYLLAPGFPTTEWSGIASEERKQEVASHYEELQQCLLAHTYRGTIARAKDIAEALITEKSKRHPSETFYVKLEDIHAQLKAGNMIISWLAFTLCQKIRLIYQYTHPEKAQEAGRPVTPELALGVAQDLIEILKDMGHVNERIPC
jgi:hypothetical protein